MAAFWVFTEGFRLIGSRPTYFATDLGSLIFLSALVATSLLPIIQELHRYRTHGRF